MKDFLRDSLLAVLTLLFLFSFGVPHIFIDLKNMINRIVDPSRIRQNFLLTKQVFLISFLSSQFENLVLNASNVDPALNQTFQTTWGNIADRLFPKRDWFTPSKSKLPNWFQSIYWNPYFTLMKNKNLTGARIFSFVIITLASNPMTLAYILSNLDLRMTSRSLTGGSLKNNKLRWNRNQWRHRLNSGIF